MADRHVRVRGRDMCQRVLAEWKRKTNSLATDRERVDGADGLGLQ